MEISILLLTYNHEKYIRQAFDSIMMQKIDVSYEIIAFDDASTDGTPEILREYKKRHPEKITLYLKKTNSGHPTKNGYFMLSKAKGKYFAPIEGDDYWTDDLKIQKQYDFLEKHKEYSGCMADVMTVDEENREIHLTEFLRKENRVFTLEDFRHLHMPGMTVAFFARNYFNEKECRIRYEADRIMGDVASYMLCLLKGDIYQMDEIMAARRYVCVSGRNNFNSIHKDNIYRNYMLIAYWIKLENFMQSYGRFMFVGMPDRVAWIASQYPAKAVFQLLFGSANRKIYLPIFFACKFLLDSHFLIEKAACGRTGRNYSWNAFRKEKAWVILFGAGAVAAEYLDKYAWQGNVLFLVDNDKSRQNTSYKGFLVMKPEEILKCRKKVKILIASKDYEEDIGRQLEGMGVKNYYCYCSMQTERLRNRIADRLLKMAKESARSIGGAV